MLTSHLNAVSGSNISINTSTQKHTTTADEEDNLNFSSEEENEESGTQVNHVDNCCRDRFFKYNDCISKSKYRTIYRGYDNESGCEIAWTTYPLHNYKRDRLLKALDEVKGLGQVKDTNNRNILRVFYNEVRPVLPTSVVPRRVLDKSRSFEPSSITSIQAAQASMQPLGVRQEELIVITELITAGSI